MLICVSICAFQASAEEETAHTPRLLKPGKAIVHDTFTGEEVSQRRLTRGDWKLQDNIASCTQDDEQFKKNKDHGPALWYDIDYHNAIISFEYKASKEVKGVVFTVNSKNGHVFRFVTNEVTDVRAWDAEHNGKRLVSDGPRLKHEQWVKVTVELAGDKSVIQIDDYVAEVQDASYDVDKSVVGFGHQYGTLSIRNFNVSEGVSP